MLSEVMSSYSSPESLALSRFVVSFLFIVALSISLYKKIHDDSEE